MRPSFAYLALLPLLLSFTCALDATEALKISDYAGAKNDGLPAFAAFLKRGLGGIVSQHALSSIVSEDIGDSPNSTAYVTAAFTGPGNNTATSVGTAVTLYGKCLDTWTHVGDAWRIKRRIIKQFVSGS